MSVNKRDVTTGELITLASGTRMWVGTKNAHDLAVQQGTMPNNCMVCITDDTTNGQTPVVMNISNSDVNVGEPFYTDKTNSMEVFKVVADAMFNNIDTSGVLKVYVGHATAYTTDDSGYPNIAVSTYIASSCWGANGHPYIRMRIFSDSGNEYILQRSQDGNYTLFPKERYSTNEVLTDKVWINGKPIYRKVIDLGALPNATTKVVNHGISNLDVIINWYGYAERPSDGGHFPLPYVFGGLPENNVGIFASQSAITITTGMDRSAMYGFIVLEYTKATD